MHPDSVWSNSFIKSEIKLGSAEINWKNFMNECLMETEIFKKKDNEKYVDPNLVMDVRHRMVKESTKLIPIPQVLIHAEALKLIRIENHNKLLRQKEGKMVEKEIAKLKQTLENHRLSAKKKINETIEKKSKPLSNTQKFPKHTILCKRLEFHNEIRNTSIWQHQSVQLTLESKINQKSTPDNFETSNEISEFSEPISPQKGSIIENESECENQIWEINEGKSEIIKRFFKEETVKVDLCDDKKPSKIMKSPEVENLINQKIMKSPEVENLINQKIMKSPEVENLINQKIMKKAWDKWKAYTQKLKSRKKERTMFRNKIEAFLVKFKENEKREEKIKQLKDIMNLKQEIRANLNLKKRTREKEKQRDAEEKEEQLEKIMKEIKTSQVEVCQKLKEIKRKSLGNEEKFANIQFLKRMEERRAERLKRRKEVEEKKRMIEEEREKAQKEKEEEKKRQEEEYKRKSLEEFKEKRRLEKEKKEKQKKEREKLMLHMRLADSYYEKYVLLNYGWRPWVALMKIRDLQSQQALEFFESRLKQKTFCKWMFNAREQLALRLKRADAFYEKVLKKKCLLIWSLLHKEKIKQDQAAVDWNEFKIIEKTFKRWLRFTQDERMDYLNKKYAAELNYERKLKMKCMSKLKSYPEFKKLEQAKENRKKKWRQKVKEILPDYQPADIIENV